MIVICSAMHECMQYATCIHSIYYSCIYIGEYVGFLLLHESKAEDKCQ